MHRADKREPVSRLERCKTRSARPASGLTRRSPGARSNLAAKLLNGRPFFFEIIVIDFSTGALNHGIAKPY